MKTFKDTQALKELGEINRELEMVDLLYQAGALPLELKEERLEVLTMQLTILKMKYETAIGRNTPKIPGL